MNQDLLQRTKHFANEKRLLSWWYVVSSFAITLGCFMAIVIVDHYIARFLLSITMGLLLVRLFILFHDYYHQAILYRSKIANVLFWIYGLLTLTPASAWRETHNFHHARTSVTEFSNIGSFKIMTVNEWNAASSLARLSYRLQRHPLTIAFGWVTVFMIGMCIQGFTRKPRENWDGLLAIGVNALLLISAIYFQQLELYFWAWLLPSLIGAALGSYIFYAQHNFPTMKLRARKDWNYVHAALHSTSFIRMPKIMHWFTGNIGYHHVHHANHRIPFYRLPETMHALVEFQTPHETSLRPKDIWSCLRLALWDPEQQRMLTRSEIA